MLLLSKKKGKIEKKFASSGSDVDTCAFLFFYSILFSFFSFLSIKRIFIVCLMCVSIFFLVALRRWHFASAKCLVCACIFSRFHQSFDCIAPHLAGVVLMVVFFFLFFSGLSKFCICCCCRRPTPINCRATQNDVCAFRWIKMLNRCVRHFCRCHRLAQYIFRLLLRSADFSISVFSSSRRLMCTP